MVQICKPEPELKLHFCNNHLVVPWLKQLVTGLLLWRPGFDPRRVNVSFVMNKMALRQVLLQALQFYLVIIVLPMLHTRSFIND